MNSSLQFETPENVQVQYQPAGLGTRFVAWFVDQVVLWILTCVVIVLLLVAGASFDVLIPERRGNFEQFDRAAMYFFGFIVLLWGLGSFAYFGGCELFLRGQTPGKRLSQIRVVKVDGFQLDAPSVLVRNVFRVVDHLPPMWVFPFLSRLGQRTGDMVAGTLVVFDSPVALSPVRTFLAERPAAEAQFRFDVAALQRLCASDYEAVERFLLRSSQLEEAQRTQLFEAFTAQLANRLQISRPPAELQQSFLEDLLAAELRRQQRSYA